MPTVSPDPRIYVTLDHLRRLEGPASGLSFSTRQPSGSALNGRHASRLRGRGLNFEEMRTYLPGDDIRSIDWKATARTRKAHVRVFTEEKDRPALVVVDQRMSMFFGSTLNMKSVTAAEAATVAAFRILKAGDRVGGIIFDDEKIIETRPLNNARAFNRMLDTIATMNQSLHADKIVEARDTWLNEVLKSVSRLARHDHLIIIFSDFEGINIATKQHLRNIAAHNDLILALISDPIATKIAPGDRTVLGDAQMQAEIDLGSEDIREKIIAQSSNRLKRILNWQREINLSVLPLSSGLDTLSQLRTLMASRSPQRRVR